MKHRLREFVRSQAFNPGFVGAFINPFFLSRRGLWKAMIKLAGSLEGKTLDIGCGTAPYRSLLRTNDYTGLDLDTPAARGRNIATSYYDGGRFPFPDASFDAALCSQVLEHVFQPDAFLAEIRRVLRPRGRLLLTVPFVWDEHEQPFDFARYSSFGLRALLERNGFAIVVHEKLLADSSALFQIANAYLYKVLLTRSRTVNILVTAVVLAPVSLAGWAAGKLLPANPDLFLDQAVVAETAP